MDDTRTGAAPRAPRQLGKAQLAAMLRSQVQCCLDTCDCLCACCDEDEALSHPQGAGGRREDEYPEDAGAAAGTRKGGAAPRGRGA